jgi:hypothetical protein
MLWGEGGVVRVEGYLETNNISLESPQGYFKGVAGDAVEGWTAWQGETFPSAQHFLLRL